jgi:transcriptional regulator with GAF, ATPase, and Fis domain
VPLVNHYVEVFSSRIGKRIDYIAPETFEAFTSYNWPGNVRELQNLIERAVILSNEGVLPNPLPPEEIEEVVNVAPVHATLKDSERALILQALEASGWVIGGPAGAAARLGVKRTTLIAKMKKLGISRPSRQNGVAMVNGGASQQERRPN